MKYRWILFLMVVILFSSVCIGCKQEDTASNKKQAEQETEIEEDVEELLVAVNVDSSVAELPFASVLLNRGRFWGTLVFQGLLIADESINNVENPTFKKFVQMISYAPYFISVVVVVAMINIFFDGENGILNNFFDALNIDAEIDWITNPKSFYALYVWSGLWQTLGWSSIIYVSALSGVSPELYEAATLEGATKLQKIWFIELPCILPTIVTLLILSAGSILGVGFEKVYLMQNPENLEASNVISTYVYEKGLLSSQYGFGTAVGLFNSVISFVILAIVNWVAKKFTNYSIM